MPQATDTFNSRIFHELDFDKPGKQIGYLRVPQSRDGGAWSTIEIPIAVVNGGNGPAVLFTGGVHGDEYEGQIAISRLARQLDPHSVKGKIIMLPAVDLPAALAGRRMCPIDGRDFNRCMPGDARGSFCQMLAHFIDSLIMPQVEVSVDVHSAGNSMEAALCSIMHWVDDPRIIARTQALAENFAAPFNVAFWGVDETATVAASAERHGALSISTEIGGYGRVRPDAVRIAERGLDNVLKWMGILEGDPDAAQPGGGLTRQMMVRDQRSYLFAPSDGLFEPRFLPEQEIHAGELAGYLHFVEEWAREPQPIEFAIDGYIWMAPGSGRVKKGDVMAVIMQDFASN
ncbi:MAG TPA: succinylglutamate desuccinylase/aspartoacylase family protein [Burkholderiales bacterium]|nr:succinylglutamate desuccinylase/aspartoacylase family protein [Burkholderiales bacterium]